MMEKLLVLVLIFSCFLRSEGALRGVHPGREKYYNPESDFTCLDGSDTIPYSLVNDDYCDCKDGSDEPGTSACTNMLFHCVNTGHQPTDIISSRVNDKICDCCDGADEWGTDVHCPNTCIELGREAQEEKRRMQELHQQGHQKRLEYSSQGKQKADQSRASLSEKEAELEGAKKEVEELEAAKQVAEEPENAAKEEHKQRWGEERAAREETQRRADAQFGFDKLDTNSDGFVSVDELRTRYELDDDNDGDNDGDISEEEALGYLNSRTSADFETFYKEDWGTISDRCQFERPAPPPPSIQPPYAPPEDQGADEGNEDNDEEDENYNSEDEEDEEDDDSAGDGMPEYDAATKELIAAADTARNAHREADGRRSNLEREISDLKKYFDVSFGVDHEFGPLYDQCYEFTDREYKYKMCMFGKVTQQSKNGGRETSLGQWGKWHGPPDNLHSVMLYENGEKCWNGPSRSATITIVCGLEEKLMSASEPNRCEYAMEFSTPAVCTTKPIHEEL